MAELPYMPVATDARPPNRYWRAPDLIVDTSAILSGCDDLSNSEFGALMRSMFENWSKERGTWRRRSSLSEAIRKKVFERDDYRCTYCQGTDGPWEVDHVHPVSAGGTDEMENLTTACRPCNRKKGAKVLAGGAAQ